MIDLLAAQRFVTLNGRLLDRRRMERVVHGASAESVLGALEAYGTGDGGFGYGLEPDIRSTSAQPLHMLAALEIFEQCDAADHPLVADACAWIERVLVSDGGVPFHLAGAFDDPIAPWWQPPADPAPSLHATAALAGTLLRMGVDHPAIDRLSAFCWDRLAHADAGAGYEMLYVVRFLDATPDRPRAEAALTEIRGRLRPDGSLGIRGGTDDEGVTPLDFAPIPGRPARALFDNAQIEARLDALEAGQRDDGGWDFDWAHWNQAVTCEWRGRLTVDALRLLAANGRLTL